MTPRCSCSETLATAPFCSKRGLCSCPPCRKARRRYSGRGLTPCVAPYYSTSCRSNTIRNLYLSDPATLSFNNRDFFTELFVNRWNREPEAFAGNVFDAIVLLALANERAGYLRSQTTGAISANDASHLKNALPEVATGCRKNLPTDLCPNTFSTFRPDQFSRAIVATRNGTNVRLEGVTGDLSLSGVGDRIGEIAVWTVEPAGEQGRFQFVESYTPAFSGIQLTE